MLSALESAGQVVVSRVQIPSNKIIGLRPRRFFQPTRSHDERTMGGECEGVLRSFLKNVGRFGLMNADHCIEAAYEINY